MSKYFEEHEYSKILRKQLQHYRNEAQISKKDLARNMNDMYGPGYNISEQKLFAIESGITKAIPAWVITGYIILIPGIMSADQLFTFASDS